MKSNVSPLYPTAHVAEAVTSYAKAHSTPLPEHITAHHAHIIATHPRSDYMISNFQSQAHIFLARAIAAKRVLEIGVYAGYSTLGWAHAVGPTGSVTGLELSPEYAQLARDVLKQNGVEHVHIVEGDALETLPILNPEEPFDIIFIDAQKSGYPTYLHTILSSSTPTSTHRLLRSGGLIIADNVLRRGLVVDDTDANPNKEAAKSEYHQGRDLECLRQYNDLVVRSDRLENWLMPLFDGVGVARLVD